MKKEIKAIRNIQYLKWCKEVGLEPQWNLTWAFEDKTMADCGDVLKLIPYIGHLKPPTGLATLKLGDAHWGCGQSREPNLYPFLEESVANLAYFFSFEQEKPFGQEETGKETLEPLESWKANYQETDLFLVDEKECLVVWDFRSSFTETHHVFDEKYRAIYLACEGIKTPKDIRSIALEKYNIVFTETEMGVMLSLFLDMGLMVKSGNYFLSLAIPTDSYSPNVEILEKLAVWLE